MLVKPEDWEHVKAIFNQAAQIHPSERPAYLASACAGDNTLRHEVDSLLASQRRSRRLHGIRNQAGTLAATRIAANVSCRTTDNQSTYCLDCALGISFKPYPRYAYRLHGKHQVLIRPLLVQAGA